MHVDYEKDKYEERCQLMIQTYRKEIAPGIETEIANHQKIDINLATFSVS